MNQFQTPQEAIAACDAECEASWHLFANAHNITEEIDQVAYKVAKVVFRAGYMNGARYVSTIVVNNLKNPVPPSPGPNA